MKYVVALIKVGDTLKKEMPFIFPNNMVHAEVGLVVAALVRRHQWGFEKIISAGDYCPFSGECSGGSETLKLKSRPEDTVLIKMNDYGAGFV